mmetsp:Transcript_9054/g.13612  ORF Transcript_9054/g.13612 Transcript_9054/m.13612 type:complete len:163 (+) Transcript_9054:25-513(+)
MPISLIEQFTGYDWARYADISGSVASIGCCVFGIVNIVFGYSTGIAIWSILCGCVLAIWEVPSACACVPKADIAHEFFMEKLYMKLPVFRAMLYTCLSIICFLGSTPCIGAGLLLFASAVLYGFAQINRNSDAFDGTNNIPQHSQSTDRTGLMGQSSNFGTF